ncbi:HEAT repeat domain-containing protein [Leptolyngbya sp. FACHB-17]|uniref:HEAT repeat domain-containing protein n=1 Tax=unclassified Leptolyngbya TaxID=2650499 RepID=UPI0016800AD7|nr:HEAT repeat domain-containing protein [Leptolyngbya sp. FACHB-17]MBD2080227.1 HEAT repeat domain-containing protein [Leptolyngbya sp. FACHB-17]
MSSKKVLPLQKVLPLHRRSLFALSGLLLAIAIPGTLTYGKQIGEFGTILSSSIVAQPSPQYQFKVGDRLTYKLDYRNIGNSDLRALFGDLKPDSNAEAPSTFVSNFDNRIQADLVMTVLKQKNDRVTVAYRLQNLNVQILSNGQLIAEQSQLIQKDLAQDIFAEVDAQGKILSVRFDPNMSNIAQSFARSLLASTQFVTAKSPTVSTWETQEDDPNGQYIAQYRSTFDQFQKSKLRYLQPDKKPRSTKLTPIITPQGQLTAKFDIKAGRLLSLSGKETQSFEVSKKKIGQSETTLNLSYSAQTQLNATDLAALQKASASRQTQAIALSYTIPEEEAEAKIQRQQLGESTLESLLSELDALSKSPDKAQNTTDLYLKIKALIYLKPETSAAFAQRILKSEATPAMQLVVGALSAVGHSQAQAALVQIINSQTQDWKTLAALIPSLATVKSPTPETIALLSNFAFNSDNSQVASTAQLALGTAAHNLLESAPNRANSIADRFVERLQKSQSSDDIKQNLLVLGNIGSARSLDAITKLTNSPQAEIRAIAVSSLRLIPEPTIDRRLTQTLQSDTEEAVRAEAAVALGFREMSPENYQSQKQAIQSDKSVKVRMALLRNLWQVQAQFPEVQQIVKQLAEKDESEEVREAASSLLSTLGAQL